MPEYTSEEVNDAFERMLNRRNAVVERLQMTDPMDPDVPLGSRPLPEGAGEAQVSALEAHFGKPFPPSYMSFLRRHDGAPWADLGTHFFSVSQIIDFDQKEKSKFFDRNIARFKRDSAKDLIMFAASPDRNTTIVFDSGTADTFGEWPVISLSKRDKVLYSEPDFVSLLDHATASLEKLRSLYR